MLCFATDRLKQKHFIHHSVILTWPTKFNIERKIIEKIRTKIKTYHSVTLFFFFSFILYDHLFNRLAI